MESNGQALFVCQVTDFQGLGRVVPNSNSLVLGAGNNQLFPDADIQSSDDLLMEGADNVVEDILVISPIQGNVHLQQLVRCSLEEESLFLLENHRSDGVCLLHHCLVLVKLDSHTLPSDIVQFVVLHLLIDEDLSGVCSQ